MFKSKIHRGRVTGSDLNYVGSITVVADLLDAADILEHELVHVLDIDNGARFETYTIAGERGSGDMCINGAAASTEPTSSSPASTAVSAARRARESPSARRRSVGLR